MNGSTWTQYFLGVVIKHVGFYDYKITTLNLYNTCFMEMRYIFEYNFTSQERHYIIKAFYNICININMKMNEKIHYSIFLKMNPKIITFPLTFFISVPQQMISKFLHPE